MERTFWRELAEGLTSEDAARACGVSGPAGSRWFREGGGMPLIELSPPSGRYLSFTEREEIALLKAQHKGVREIARCLGRSPSTISRELRRNAATRGGRLDYRASIAQWKAELMTAHCRTDCAAKPGRRRPWSGPGLREAPPLGTPWYRSDFSDYFRGVIEGDCIERGVLATIKRGLSGAGRGGGDLCPK
ncbi:hypothetical protein GCM10020001_038920 [Nonomuraea salmonea]